MNDRALCLRTLTWTLGLMQQENLVFEETSNKLKELTMT